jgi:AcrR family transcriptional regulator
MELYAERGYDATTVAEIAERAGLTERTFFRHFADKREVLFDGGESFVRTFVGAVADAPASTTAFDAIARGLDAAAALLEDNRGREFARRRQRIINANTDLQERELIKLASLASAVADTLGERGVARPAAVLSGEVAVAVFKSAFARWLDEKRDRELRALIRETLATLRALDADDRTEGKLDRLAGAGARARARKG